MKLRARARARARQLFVMLALQSQFLAMMSLGVIKVDVFTQAPKGDETGWRYDHVDPRFAVSRLMCVQHEQASQAKHIGRRIAHGAYVLSCVRVDLHACAGPDEKGVQATC